MSRDMILNGHGIKKIKNADYLCFSRKIILFFFSEGPEWFCQKNKNYEIRIQRNLSKNAGYLAECRQMKNKNIIECFSDTPCGWCEIVQRKLVLVMKNVTSTFSKLNLFYGLLVHFNACLGFIQYCGQLPINTSNTKPVGHW